MNKFIPARRMLVSSMIDAAIALIIVLIVRKTGAIWAGLGITLGIILGSSGYLFLRFRQLMMHARMWRRVVTKEMLLNRDLLMSALGRMEFAAFAWSATLVNPAISAILFSTWPIMHVLFLERSVKRASGEERYTHINAETMVYFAVAFAGLALVISAQPADINFSNTDFAGFVSGIILAMLAAFLAASNAFIYPWGVTLRSHLVTNSTKAEWSETARELEIATTMLGTMVSTVLAIPILIVLSLTEPRARLSGGSLGIMVLVGMSLVTYSLLLQRRANLGTENLGVNAIAYTMPVFSLALFRLFGLVEGVRMDFVVMGSIAIVAMNLFLSFDPDYRLGFNRRMSFKALVIGFWAVGCTVYMRDEWLPSATVTLDAGAYWSLIALIGTTFTLILSFRVSKIHTRTSYEEHHTALVFRKLEDLVRRGIVHPLAIRSLIGMDSAHRPADLSRHYVSLRRCFRRARRSPGYVDSAILGEVSAVEGEVDSLVQSKQFGREFAELVSVILLGALTIFLLAVVRPKLNGWTGLGNDIASIVICAVIVFLIVNLFDLHRERHTPFIVGDTKIEDEFGVLLRQGESPLFEQAMSGMTGVGIVVAFAMLLYFRWL